ncbi:MAG: hypothetical protein AB1700_11485 [Bacillota bacterium]
MEAGKDRGSRILWERVNPKAWHDLVRCTGDFECDVEAFQSSPYESSGWERVSSGELELPPAYTVFVLFVQMLKYGYWGKGEKVAWTIPFKYKGERYVVSYEKFGLRIRTPSKGDSKRTMNQEMVIRLNRAAAIAERLLEPLVKVQVSRGNVSVQNKYHLFNDQYRFFREKAKSAFQSPPPPPKVISRSGDGKPTGWEYAPFQPIREGFFYTQAMLDGYFSLLEHILVLLLPFCDYDPAQDDITSLMSSDWTTKYNRIFQPQVNRRMMTLYNALRCIRERYRNTFAHGGYEKKGASLFVHLPHVGAIPFTLSKFRTSVNSSVFPIEEPTFDRLCSVIDQFEAVLNEEPFRRPMAIIRSGLHLHFDEKARAAYKAAVQSDKALEDYLDYASYVDATYANMDW